MLVLLVSQWLMCFTMYHVVPQSVLGITIAYISSTRAVCGPFKCVSTVPCNLQCW